MTSFFRHVHERFSSPSPFDGINNDVLKSELLSAEQMGQYGLVLAARHKVSATQGPDSLLARLADNEEVIKAAHQVLMDAAAAKHSVTPAGEWMLDNFYLIEEQIEIATRHLPRGYSRGLPRLEKGPSNSLPRVYDIALEIISHSDAGITEEMLTLFISSYQKIAPLKLGELWAIPIMLRLALIENLRRVSARLSRDTLSRNLVDYWATEMIETVQRDPTELILVIADMARSNPALDGAFVAELVRRLQGQGAALALPLTWIEQRLSQQGTTIEQVIYTETRQQASDQVSVSNSIGSLRFLNKMDWRDFVEAMSVVDQTLRADPAQMYAAMDFQTRDIYRHSIEKISKYSQVSEELVARAAIELAAAASGNRQRHVGYFLIDKGLRQLQKLTRMRAPLMDRLRDICGAYPLATYLGAVAAITILTAGWLFWNAYHDAMPQAALVIIGVAGVFGASHLALGLVNWIATMLARPSHLPRLDFSKFFPVESKTLVAIPTLITSHKSIDDLSEGLEVRYLANNSKNVVFGLLTDFTDAAAEILPQDAELLDHAQRNIDALNKKYAPEGHDIFFLLHRPRRWNAQEKTWMGYERKRGKLGDLNEFLLTGDAGQFNRTAGRLEALTGVKFVVTLDTDTELPRDSVRQFAGVMSHPLNRPYYDSAIGRVTEGYGILQPRVAVSLPGTTASLYARLCGGEPGIDPYTRAVSDVYQDAFGEGSFVGKGIYDVAAFEQALKGRFPENRILSHDLIEGCHARSGLLSDVQLYEEYPSRYSADVARRHRWVRGDWQIARWMMPRVPGGDGKSIKNPLSALSRWKIFDNLRRSIVPVALMTMMCVGWAYSSTPSFWSFTLIGLLLIPSMGACLLDLSRKASDVKWKQHLLRVAESSARHLGNACLVLLCLPYEAWYQTDAILRVLWRMTISKKRLLEWNPSSVSNAQKQSDVLSAVRVFWISPLFSTIFGGYLYTVSHAAFMAALPFLALWFVLPIAAWKLSQPAKAREPQLSASQINYLGRISRKIWSFFETYVGPEDNWLPPDNMQETPVAAVAHRTSPTNMGMALLANLTAYDFGYISGGKLLQRTEDTLSTMHGLSRYKGHFYNWYDTQTLKPMYPVYISTVDSGNLAGHLLTLAPGLEMLLDQPIFSQRLFGGLQDTLNLVTDLAEDFAAEPLRVFNETFTPSVRPMPETLSEARRYTESLQTAIREFRRSALNAGNHEVNRWAENLSLQCDDTLADLKLLTPWIFADYSSFPPETAAALDRIPTLRELARYESALVLGEEYPSLRLQVTAASELALERVAVIRELVMMCQEMSNMEYDFLYDPDGHLFTVGYNVQDRRRDPGLYDLLASEARLATFVAIAQGKIAQESWFALGRQLIGTLANPTLVSWSGSMFEYLMPLLVMPTFEHTLIDQTYKSAVRRQIDYGRQNNVPWGVSESGYNAFDAHLNYQYKAFGVPDLGIKRGLANDLVIAPYASVMALMVLPEEACANMQRLSAEEYEGRYGLYEAIDYTPARLPRGKTRAVIRSYMAHHQGMSFLSLSYLLLGRPMQRRFEANPQFQATMLLLHEKIPKTSLFANASRHSVTHTAPSTVHDMPIRVLHSTNTPVPEVQLLSNGRYHVMVTNGGGSYSRWNDLALTRWREDATRDNWGSFCYVRDLATGDLWSAGYQPTLKKSPSYEVIFSEGRAEFRRTDNEFEMHTEIVVSPEDDIELRRCRIKNRSRKRRTIEVTSYAEVVLAPAAADAAHPAFSKLFVQTEILRKSRSIICTRRPRSATERPFYMFHQMVAHGGDIGQISYETDRMKFIGRGRNTSSPAALRDSEPLSGAQGSVLDPVVAIRYHIALDPGETVTLNTIMGAAETRDACISMIDKYKDFHLAERVFELTWTHSQVLLRQINASESDAQLYARLANSIVFSNAALRADASVLIRNRRGQSGLWGYAISGDLPIVLLQVRDMENIELVRQLVQAHAYWRLKGLAVDLVIWNEDNSGYRQELQQMIMDMISAGIEAHVVDRPGGIFVRPGDQISMEDRILLESVARVILSDNKGSLAEQVNKTGAPDVSLPRLVPAQDPRSVPDTAGKLEQPALLLFNGTGGFSPDGREYVIMTGPDRKTPAPWVNIIANPHFGSVISETGSAYTWSENAHAFRLTPWVNDPVSDAGGEAFYIRDEATGEFWSPMPWPVPSQESYITRHGFGYSSFEHIDRGIHTEMTVFVAMDASVKFFALRLRNDSGRARQLSVTGYVEWVMGDLRAKTGMHVITETDPVTGALFARNAYNTEFAERIAFFDVDDESRAITADRREFIGRNKSLRNPDAMSRFRLSGRVGAGLDPCGALQVPFTLADGEEREIIFRLGVAGRQNADQQSLVRRFAEAGSVIRRFRGSFAARIALEGVHRYWREALGAVQVQTPDVALNILSNGWLIYQTLACRLWARSGYYQSGGAFGFRDQLQDAMALIHARPLLLRDQLLLHASRQFTDGDVQHWWHPPAGRGVRTKCSDDFLWLPLATCRYVASTGDTGVLDEIVSFIEARQLNADEDSNYDLPAHSAEYGSLYEHCVRAIRRGLNYGAHGLPLIGSCDWNDGMDKVGEHGQGESVWLAFFTYDILLRFAPIAEKRGDTEFAALCRSEAEKLQQSVEANAWDGSWYRRAYFDDGTPLGSAQSAECQIDSLSQSWSILSGAGNPERSAQGMAAVDERLVRRNTGIIQLLDPPFDKAGKNPGYIRGYVPGVRENGGQYTHAAIWTVMAFAKMGDHARTWELLQMINPLNHARTPEEVAVYKVEPYVVTADVYAQSPHAGRGGWSWYTGSSGWMYRLIVESFLGLKLEVNRLSLAPCVPKEWKGFRIEYRYRTTIYKISVVTGSNAPGLTVDGQAQPDTTILLEDDQQPHEAELRIA